MPLIKTRKNGNEELVLLKRIIHCPACNCNHVFKDEKRRKWKVLGSIKRPTIKPDFKARVALGKVQQLCHFRIEDGKISYFGDCEHDMAGKTVDMVDFDTLEE